jgi:FdhD protein
MNPALRPVDIVRVGHDHGAAGRDNAAAEEPLEIRLGDRPFVVIMRTPGADHELVAGFLLAEQIIRNESEIGSIRHCARAPGPAQPGYDPIYTDLADGNVINVWLTGEAAARTASLLANRRNVTSTSSCGVCGRKSIDDLMNNCRRLDSTWSVAPAVISAMPDRLRSAQRVFDETGGLHAAGLFNRDGALLHLAEDVGRHNAVDKVIGTELLRHRVPLSDHVLFVSGRTSFEIVQKALVAGVPLVASVSAPSSLAIDLARDGNVTLLGFVRGTTFNIYAGAHRIAMSGAPPAD